MGILNKLSAFFRPQPVKIIKPPIVTEERFESFSNTLGDRNDQNSLFGRLHQSLQGEEVETFISSLEGSPYTRGFSNSLKTMQSSISALIDGFSSLKDKCTEDLSIKAGIATRYLESIFQQASEFKHIAAVEDALNSITVSLYRLTNLDYV